jgi:putative peptidoglycan lipid II flippase
MTFISRILGFARDLIAAQMFGVSASVDAFYIAFKIPNFMRNLFAEGSFSQAFVPVLSDYQQIKTKDEVLVFISRMSGLLTLILFVVTLLGVWRANNLVSFFSPGLDDYRFDLATSMLRITFPYVMLISLTAFVGSVLNSLGKFGTPSFTPALLNISFIVSALCFAHYFTIPIKSQAWGLLVAGFVQLFFQLIVLYRVGFLVRPTLVWRDMGVRKVLKLIVPSLFGASMGQLSILVNTVLASFLATGSITWLYYSERLAYFPLGVFGVALTTVILPHLSRQHAVDSKEGFVAALEWGIRWNLIIGFPASVAMLVLSGPLIVSLFQYGKFTLHDVLMTKQCVIAYAIGLQAFMLAKILSSAFYARQDIRTPVTISMVSLCANVMLSFVFVWPLAHAGLALATSISSWINVIALARVLYRNNVFSVDVSSWLEFLLKLGVANAIVAVVLWLGAGDIDTWFHLTWLLRLLWVLGLGFGSCVIYSVLLWATDVLPRKAGGSIG